MADIFKKASEAKWNRVAIKRGHKRARQILKREDRKA